MLNSLKILCASFEILTLAFILTLFPQASGAVDQYPGDTVIYGVSSDTIAPNVLVIFDNSGSMNQDIVTGTPYDHNITYTQVQSCDGSLCETDAVYRWRSKGKKWEHYISDVNTISCSKAKNKLKSKGLYTGKLRQNGTCKKNKKSYAIGNYINWLALGGGSSTKLEIAKEVLTNLISSTYGVNFGMMLFNTYNGGHIAGVGDSFGYSGYDAYVKNMDAIFSGTETNRTALVNTINNVNANTWTPLAETLYESMRYYKGDTTYFNGSYTYTSPIEYSCQQNYIILITDGESTQDQSSVLATICNNGDCDGDDNEPANDNTKTYSYNGSDYLDDVAKYLYETDLLPDTPGEPRTEGIQRVITYTIGFGLAGKPSAERLLQETATNGGGEYYSASYTAGLSESLRQIIASIVEENTSFVAPVLPINPENRTFSGDRVYLGFFKPGQQAFWSGNLKKFGIDEDGEILGKDSERATNADGSIKDTAISYWSSLQDGGTVESGGTGEKLINRLKDRDIYTYTGTSRSLTNPSNLFSTTNTAVTAALLNVATDTDKDRLIEFVHGKDSYDSDTDGNTTETRDWILGDILHSRPHIINYSSFNVDFEGDCQKNQNIIYVGSNDGMLHAFNDCKGEEEWAFIPPNLLPELTYLNGGTHTYFVDGSPSSYVYDANNDGNIDPAVDKAVLIFGERRGGGYYYALDVTEPLSPSLLWWISGTTVNGVADTSYAELAETWSRPSISKVRLSSGDKVVAFFGAGYDNDAEDLEPADVATKGRAFYATLVATLSASGAPTISSTGSKFWSFTSGLSNSVPSKISLIDSQGGGFIDMAYVGDTGGNLWRLNIGSLSTASWSARKIFSSAGHKFFYNTAVTQESRYKMVFIGSGDRAHPLDKTSNDRLYGIKDIGQTVATTEASLSNATAGKVNIGASLGWYLPLPHTGEKSLAAPTVLSNVAYFTTYIPPTVTSVTCSDSASGTAMFYAMNHLTTEAAYNYNEFNDAADGSAEIDKTDRSKNIGEGIPSSLAVRISNSGATALVGSAGSLVKETLTGAVLSIPSYWREVY